MGYSVGNDTELSLELPLHRSLTRGEGILENTLLIVNPQTPVAWTQLARYSIASALDTTSPYLLSMSNRLASCGAG